MDERETIVQVCKMSPPSLLAGEDYTPVTVRLQLSGSLHMTCFNVFTLENKKPQHSREFKIQIDVRSQSSVRLLELMPDVLTVKILDNDGETNQCVRPGITLANNNTVIN